jgi:signal transduction histidine kinase/ActR/RegA family two-component response regulator
MIAHTVTLLLIMAVSFQKIKKEHIHSLSFFMSWLAMLPGPILYFTQNINIGINIPISPNTILISHVIQMIFLANSLYLFDLRKRRIDRHSLEESTANLQTINNELNSALVQLEKNSIIKDRFLSTMSHELRTPMNGVEGALELIRTQNLTAEQKNYLQTAKASAQEMTTLIGSILRFSEIGNSENEVIAEPFELRAALSSISIQLRKKCQTKGLQGEWYIAKDVPLSINSDRDKILLILQQLIDNAIKFTEKGSVKISIETHSDNSGKNSHLQFSVSDTGIGISKRQLETISNTFKKLDDNDNREHQDLGIGLSICQQLTALIDGTLTVTSKINEGSTFIFNLPLKTSHTTTLPTPNASSQNNSTAYKTILVAEDNQTNQLILKSMLEKIGYMVLTADDGEQVLHVLNSQPIDLIMMDCQMPIMDGYETTRKIRSSNKAYSSIPIVAVTANAMSKDNIRCINAGMSDYIKKPINFEVVKQKVERWTQSNHAIANDYSI